MLGFGLIKDVLEFAFYCEACVRGVICKRCNLVLGCTSDSPEHLIGLLRYLKKAGGN